VQELLRYVDAAGDVRDQGEGTYALIRIGEAGGVDDAAASAGVLARLPGNPDLADAIRRPEIAEVLASSMNEVVRLGEFRNATNQLEALLDGGEAKEDAYQDWLEQYTWARGHAYVARDKVRRIGAGDTVDLLLEAVANGLRDIYELKRPDMRVMNWDEDHKCCYWNSDVTKAIGQCHRYLDVLHDHARKGLDDHPEIVAYHPRALIIIGRSKDWDKAKVRSLHGLNARLHGITVMTYDQLLAQCKVLVSQASQ
jgi:hypothetical protein